MPSGSSNPKISHKVAVKAAKKMMTAKTTRTKFFIALQLCSRQTAIFDAVRLIGVVTETAFAVDFVFAVISVKEFDF